MIRPAKFADIPRLMELLHEMRERSKYANKDEIDLAAAKQLLVGSLQRATGKGPGATCAFVAENDGHIEGFIVGVLDRVYHIGKRLWATDLFFYTTKQAGPRDFERLFDAFEEWAMGNPKVIEIHPGVSDAINSDPTRLGRFYRRRGYAQDGLMFQRMVER